MARRDLDEWFWQVGEEFMRLTEEKAPSQRRISGRRYWQPRVDVFEDEQGNFFVRAELAGVRSEDVQVGFLPDRGVLVIRGVRREEDLPTQGKIGCHQLEIFYGDFQREVEVPRGDVDARSIRAQYKNGYLLVIVPLRRTETARRSVKARSL